MNELTPRQRAVYAAIVAYIEGKRYSPAIRDLCTAVGVDSTNTVWRDVHALADAGLIEFDARITRSIRVIATVEHSCDKSQSMVLPAS